MSPARALRSWLEGGVEARPGNVRLAVTSNRRAIVARHMSEQDDPLNPRDAVDDRLALADRFGAFRVLIIGGLLYALGLAGMALATTGAGFLGSAGLLLLYGAAMAWLFLGEPVGWHHAVGAALILPGIWLVSRRPGVSLPAGGRSPA